MAFQPPDWVGERYIPMPEASYRRRRSSRSRSEPTVKACLVGDTDVGKSTFLIRYTRDEFKSMIKVTQQPEVAFKTIEYMQRTTTLEIWDIPGQVNFGAVHPSIFRNGRVFIFIYDIACRDSFINLNYWKTRVDELSNNNDLICALCGNKTDDITKAREVTVVEGQTRAAEWGIRYFDISAKTGEGTDELFKYIARQLNNRRDLTRESVGIRLTPDTRRPSSPRCSC